MRPPISFFDCFRSFSLWERFANSSECGSSLWVINLVSCSEFAQAKQNTSRHLPESLNGLN